MLQGLTGWHFLALLVIILLLFGAAKLPALAKSLGQSARVFKGEMKELKKDDEPSAGAAASASVPADPIVGATVPSDAAHRSDGSSTTSS